MLAVLAVSLQTAAGQTGEYREREKERERERERGGSNCCSLAAHEGPLLRWYAADGEWFM